MNSVLQYSSPSPFGTLLKRWRRIRRLSQLEVACLSDTSPRHISFIETGRARPGKDLILELAEVLRLPHRNVNEFLRAAGFPSIYPEAGPSQSIEMAPYLELVHSIVHSNAEIPCFVIDRWWRMQEVNFAMRCLFSEMGTCYDLPDEKDIIDRILGNDSQTSILINFEEVARQFLVRLRSEISTELGDEEIEKLALKAESKIKLRTPLLKEEVGSVSLPLVMRPQFRLGDDVYSALCSVSRFGSASQVELSELRIVDPPCRCPIPGSIDALPIEIQVAPLRFAASAVSVITY